MIPGIGKLTRIESIEPLEDRVSRLEADNNELRDMLQQLLSSHPRAEPLNGAWQASATQNTRDLALASEERLLPGENLGTNQGTDAFSMLTLNNDEMNDLWDGRSLEEVWSEAFEGSIYASAVKRQPFWVGHPGVLSLWVVLSQITLYIIVALGATNVLKGQGVEGQISQIFVCISFTMAGIVSGQDMATLQRILPVQMSPRASRWMRFGKDYKCTLDGLNPEELMRKHQGHGAKPKKQLTHLVKAMRQTKDISAKMKAGDIAWIPILMYFLICLKTHVAFCSVYCIILYGGDISDFDMVLNCLAISFIDDLDENFMAYTGSGLVFIYVLTVSGVIVPGLAQLWSFENLPSFPSEYWQYFGFIGIAMLPLIVTGVIHMNTMRLQKQMRRLHKNSRK